MKQSIILLGAGGHCRSVIDVIESDGRFLIKGIVDRKEMIGREISGYKVIGADEDIPSLLKEVNNFHISIGHIKSNAARVRLYDTVKELGGTFPPIVSSRAYVSKHAVIGEGTIVMHNAFVNAGARVGNNSIINTGSVIEHDVVVGNHCHISTGAFVNGECKVNDHSFVGSNATLVQCITIAEWNVIAAGAVVTRSTEPEGLYAGNPAELKGKTR